MPNQSAVPLPRLQKAAYGEVLAEIAMANVTRVNPLSLVHHGAVTQQKATKISALVDIKFSAATPETGVM